MVPFLQSGKRVTLAPPDSTGTQAPSEARQMFQVGLSRAARCRRGSEQPGNLAAIKPLTLLRGRGTREG